MVGAHWTRATLLVGLLACSGASSTTPPAPATTEAPMPAPDAPARRAPTKLEAPDPMPHPLTADQLKVGTERALVVLATSPGPDREDASFQIAVSSFTAILIPVQELWLGCQPAAVAAVGQDGERWAAVLSFASRAEAESYVRGKGLSPLAIVEDEVEACGD